MYIIGSLDGGMYVHYWFSGWRYVCTLLVLWIEVRMYVIGSLDGGTYVHYWFSGWRYICTLLVLWTEGGLT